MDRYKTISFPKWVQYLCCRIIKVTLGFQCSNNFSIENKLGEGGFGPVYKVRLVSLTIMPFRKAHLVYTDFLLLGVIVLSWNSHDRESHKKDMR